MFALDMMVITFALNTFTMSFCHVKVLLWLIFMPQLLFRFYNIFCLTELLHRFKGVLCVLIRSCCPICFAGLFVTFSFIYFVLNWSIDIVMILCLIMVALAIIDFHTNILCYGIWMTYNITNVLNVTNVYLFLLAYMP